MPNATHAGPAPLGAHRQMSGSRIRSFIVRHRVSLQDLGLLVAVLLVCAYIAFEVDIFETEGAVTPHEETIELDEALLLGGILSVGLLVFATRRYFEQKREAARRTAAERRARELAYQDPLTGLANRRQFDEALRRAVASPPKAGSAHAVLMLDLNGFKKINDIYGHGMGDEVLVLVTQRLLGAMREGDLVARFGGDEFAVLALHLLGPEAATSIAMRIIQGLAEPLMIDNVRVEVGAGIGIALLPADAASAAEIVRKADIALYRAKAERRSAFRFFEEDMDQSVRERQALEAALRQAVQQRELGLRFRPAFDLRTGAVVSFEAVPVWAARDVGEVPAERFLPIAEESGLVHTLARQLLEEACRAAAQWPSRITLSVNVLPGQLKDAALGSGIREVLRDTGLEPGRLEIEIAEDMIVQELEAAKAALLPLREDGVRIVLDNFGTGYSSLYHIQEFKLDKVKIDRRFVENLDEAEASRLVRALAGMGHGLGVDVSAEGVDTPRQGAPLLDSGVSVGQSATALVSVEEARRLAG